MTAVEQYRSKWGEKKHSKNVKECVCTQCKNALTNAVAQCEYAFKGVLKEGLGLG